MESLLLVGGSGFIGKNLIRCLEDKYIISVADKFIDQYFFANYPQIKTIQIEPINHT